MSLSFILIYTGIAFLVYLFIPRRFKAPYLLAVSLGFYGWLDPAALPLLILLIVGSYFLGRQIGTGTEGRKRGSYFAAGITAAVLTFCFFKYAGLLIGYLGEARTGGGQILVPLGMSYYMLKIISYLADVYRRTRRAEESLLIYALYVAFFPQIICGPIERSSYMTEQLHRGIGYDKTLAVQGVSGILQGVFKKTVIADRVGPYVNTIFASPSSYPAVALWLAAFLYAVQLYCDFSGYSDIAVGFSNLFGLECRPNFDHPYFASNIKEFWKKWHISLSSWLRDYIYIPLGGNRAGKARKKWNLFATFLVSGLWHGTGLQYLAWGLWHGLLNLFPARRRQADSGKREKATRAVGILINFICVTFGWILFRSSSLSAAGVYLREMFRDFSLSFDTLTLALLPFTMDYTCVAYFLTAAVFLSLLFVKEWKEEFQGKDYRDSVAWNSLFLTAVILFGIVGNNSFLYAQF